MKITRDKMFFFKRSYSYTGICRNVRGGNYIGWSV